LAQEVGLPIHPPKRNVNSRFALETAELIRASQGDDAVGVFCLDVSRAFFTKHADISKREIIVPAAERFGISAPEIEDAWNEHRFSRGVETFMQEGHMAGVTGVPAMGWPHWRAIVGMSPAADLVRLLQIEAPDA
jgi:predicted DsbA family dithiol-disulfide isomerase